MRIEDITDSPFKCKLLLGNSFDVLKNIPKNTFHMAVTSPPYWDQRNYNVEDQLGQETTPEEYVENLLNICKEVKRTLREDGTFWLNIGDGYCKKDIKSSNLKQKDLVGIPWLVAFALRKDGWYLRSDIIWKKTNPMPESQRTRPSKSYEHLFLFSKSKKYFYDAEAIAEPQKEISIRRAYSRNRVEERKDYQNDNYAISGKSQDKTYEKMRKMLSELGSGEVLTCNKKDVWELATADNKIKHFACVTSDTEILTIEGWKKYTEIERYEHGSPKYIKVATYNLEKKIIEYQKLGYIKEYDFDGDLIKIGNRDLDILVTENHRNVVVRKNKKESIINSNKILFSDCIKVLAPMVYPENRGIGKTFAELLGWIISEGGYQEYGVIKIYQNQGKKANRIDYLLKKLEIPHSRYVRKRSHKGKNRKEICWYLKNSPLVQWARINVPDKKLNKFLVSLPLNEIKALFKGLILGDGHIRKDDGRISFIQKDKSMHDWFQIISMRLGYHPMTTKTVTYLSKKEKIGVRGTNGHNKNIFYKAYKGKVWCPTVPNGTWIARRNGRIFITGNSYPIGLIKPCILAGSSSKGCCPKCKDPWIREDNNQWKPSCNCGETKIEACLVIDPFNGSGTTGRACKSYDRKYVGIDISEEYLSYARESLIDKQHNIAAIEEAETIEELIDL